MKKAPKKSQLVFYKGCGVSLGSMHYCANALVKKCGVKVKNFKNAQNKLAFAYILTLSGTHLKKELTIAFLKRKQAECVALYKEIKALEDDLALCVMLLRL